MCRVMGVTRTYLHTGGRRNICVPFGLAVRSVSLPKGLPDPNDGPMPTLTESIETPCLQTHSCSLRRCGSEPKEKLSENEGYSL